MSIQAVSPQPIFNRAAGQYQSVSIQYTSTLSLSGKTLFFNPALWLDSYAEVPVLPQNGYSVVYPFIGGTIIDFTQINSANSASQKNIRAELETIDNRNFIVRLYFIALADIDNYITTQNIPPLTRVLNKGIAGTNVYDQSKLLVFWLGYQSGNNNIVSYESINFAAGHFNRSINNGSPLSNWSYVLQAANVPVQSFSLLDDTRISFVIPSANLPIQAKWYFGLIQTTNAQGTGNFWTGVNMQYAEINAGAKVAVEGIPNNRIVSQWGILNIGLSGLCNVTIDKDYFSSGEQYRFFIAVQMGSTWQSWMSPDIGVEQNFPASYGDITVSGEILENGLTYGNCLNNAIPGTTLRVCFDMDKASYNAALAANGVGLNFDANLQSVQIIRVSGIPVSNGVPSGTNLPTAEADNPTNYLACTDVVVDPADIGENVYLACIWTFNVQSINGTYTDTIVSYSRYTPQEAEEPVNISLQNISINGESGDIPATYCSDLQGEMDILIALDDVCPDYDYTITLHEKDNPSNTYNDCIISVDEVPNGVERLNIKLNIECLPVDIELCVTITILCESLSESQCLDCYNYTAQVRVTSLGPGFVAYDFDFDYSAFTGFSHSAFEITTPSGQENETSDQPTGSFSFFDVAPGPNVPVFVLVYATVEANGCLYEMCYVFNFTPEEVGETLTIESEACPGPNECENVVTFGNPCIEIAPELSLECVEPGVVSITGDAPSPFALFYNFDGSNDWLPYTDPVEIEPGVNPSCSVFAKLTIEATELCPEINVYGIIDDCCPEIECPVLECEPIVFYNEGLELLSLGYDCGSEETPDDVAISFSIDGGITWELYISPIDVSNVDQVLWEIVVDYSSSYPLCDPNRFDFTGTWNKEGAEEGSCDSNPGLTAQVTNGCHTATATGDTFFVDTDTIYFSIDNGVTFNEWNGIPICGVDIVVWKREVCYTNDCPCDCKVAVSVKDNVIDVPVNCECVEWTISINKTGDLLCPVVFGLDDYTLEWHIGSNGGYTPIGYDGNGCVTLTQNGLYRLTVEDVNGCKRYAYRLHFVCEDCPVCELTIEKINEDGFGTYLATVDCEAEFTGEWQKWSTTENDWEPVGNSNPFTPQEIGLFRYVGIVDGNPECPIEASVIVCEGEEPFCECYESSVNITNSQSNLFDIVVGSNYSLRDNIPASFNFPYTVTDPADVLLLVADLEAYYNENPSDCQAVVTFETVGTNYVLQINCMNGSETDKTPLFARWRTAGNLQAVFTVNTDCDCSPSESVSESVSESASEPVSESISEPCANFNWTAEMDGTLGAVLEEVSLSGGLNLSGVTGFNFPYDFSDSLERDAFALDFFNWSFDLGYEACPCLDPEFPFPATYYPLITDNGGSQYTMEIKCWRNEYPDFLTWDFTNNGGSFTSEESGIGDNCCAGG